MQHSSVFICSRKLMMILTGTIFLLISLDTALGVSYYNETVTLSFSKETVIKSSGYPHKNYESNTNYTWYVIASDKTENISIEITTDIHEVPGFKCDDYLQIQEINPSGRKFTLFKQCGQLNTTRIARGNRLLITLTSNHDMLTSKGFQLKLKALKVDATLTTRKTSTQSKTTKTRTTASTVKTTVFKATTKSTLTKTITSTLLPSTAKSLKASTVKVLMSSTTTTTNTTTESTTSETPLTTRKTITTIPNVTLTTNATTLLTKSRTLQTSTETTSTIRTTDGNNSTIHLSQSPRNSYSSPITTESNKESTTIWLSSSQSVEMKSTLYQKSTTNTQTQPKQSSTSATRIITTTMDTVTDTTTSSSISGNSLEMKTVILLIGLGVLEVTLIVVGVLAAQRYRRKRNSNPSRQASKRIDDDANTLKRQNSCGEKNVYDEINIDDVKEEKEEENPYKELPEGVYDTTLKRRSYLKVVGERKSNYSRGSIINMFRTSSFFRRKVNETSVMTFSSFKGPIQSQISEKNNQ